MKGIISFKNLTYLIELIMESNNIMRLIYPTISGENEYHLIIIEKNNRTIDIITNCLCIDVGLLYYLSKVDYSFIKINGIFFDISDIPMYNYVYNISIVDSQNMYVSFPIQNIPDCLYTNFKIPKICLIHKNYNLHEQLLENTIKINIFVNYTNFNILLREQAISFTKVFDSIECEFPYKTFMCGLDFVKVNKRSYIPAS